MFGAESKMRRDAQRILMEYPGDEILALPFSEIESSPLKRAPQRNVSSSISPGQTRRHANTDIGYNGEIRMSCQRPDLSRVDALLA